MNLNLEIGIKMMADSEKCFRKYQQEVTRSGSVRTETAVQWWNRYIRYEKVVRYLLARSYR